MAYVSRDPDGTLSGAFKWPQPGLAEELLADDHAELVAFLAPRPPGEVSPLQARKALRRSGLIEQVNAAVAAAAPEVQDAWEYATVIRRGDEIVAALAATLKLTAADLDRLFILAATL